jgi:putative NADH-flavin reductase
MKIAILGATGYVGSHLLLEAQHRGHVVTAVARHAQPLAKLPNVLGLSLDVSDGTALVAALAGHDAVISALRFMGSNPQRLIDAATRAGVPRLLVVGGAGSLEVAPGKALVDTPDFPAEYEEEALAGRAFLEELRKEQTLDWTFLSPAAQLEPGQRTGKFRTGDDRLLMDEHGVSRISVEDYAVAMVDELEQPKHHRRRFTVAY